jgi:hypothetical protein
MSVYSIEIVLMLATIITMLPLIKKNTVASKSRMKPQAAQVVARW